MYDRPLLAPSHHDVPCDARVAGLLLCRLCFLDALPCACLSCPLGVCAFVCKADLLRVARVSFSCAVVVQEASRPYVAASESHSSVSEVEVGDELSPTRPLSKERLDAELSSAGAYCGVDAMVLCFAAAWCLLVLVGAVLRRRLLRSRCHGTMLSCLFGVSWSFSPLALTAESNAIVLCFGA